MLKMKLRPPQEGVNLQWELALLCDSCHKPITSAADCHLLWRIVQRFEPHDPGHELVRRYEGGEVVDGEPIFVHNDCSGYYVVDHGTERWQEWIGNPIARMWPFAISKEKPDTPTADTAQEAP